MKQRYLTFCLIILLVIIALHVVATAFISKTFIILPATRISSMLRSTEYNGIKSAVECVANYLGIQATGPAMYCEFKGLCSIGEAPTDVVLQSAVPDAACNIYYKRIYEDWDYVFGAKNGTGMKVRDTWTDPTYICENQSCVYLYKRGDVNNWIATNPSEVLQVYYQGSTPVAWLQFNAVASTLSGWFEESRLMNASWTDMLTASHNKFCVVCGTAAHWRRFYVSHFWGGCTSDVHWVFVLEYDGAPVCSYEQMTPYPVFLYSKIQTKTNFEMDPDSVGRAEWFTIYIK